MLSFMQDVICQTPMFHHIPNTEKKSETTKNTVVFLDDIRGVWKCGKTLFRVF